MELADALTTVSQTVLSCLECKEYSGRGYKAELSSDVSTRQRTVTQECTASAKDSF